MNATVIRGPWPRTTPGAPPSAEYLATRDRLGMPSHPAVITVACPWCLASVIQPCRVKATGQTLRRPHDARQQRVTAMMRSA